MEYLYEGTDSVYNVDQILYKYQNLSSETTDFTTILNPGQLFLDYNKFTLNYEIIPDVNARSSIYAQSNLSFYGPLTSTSTLPTVSTASTAVSGIEYTVILTKSATVSSAANIISNIYSNFTDNYLQNTNNSISTSHSNMSGFMNTIVQSTSYIYFNEAVNLMSANVSPAVNSLANIIEISKSQIKNNITAANCLYIIQQLNMYISSVIEKLINSLIKTKKKLQPDMMHDFLYGGFKSPFYYRLRNTAAAQMNLKSLNLNTIFASQDASVVYVVKKILVDLFIKSCYPLLQYTFIDVMMKIYMDIGDYVNSRVALLAKIGYTHNMFNSIYNLTTYAPGSMNTQRIPNQNSSSNNATYISFQTTINNILIGYLTEMNNVNIKGNSTGSSAIAVAAHTLQESSDQVVKDNLTVQTLKTEISNNQLAMRNILHNTETMKKKYKTEVTIFLIALIAMILILIITGVLIYMKKSTWVMGFCGASIVCIIMIQFFLWINRFISNK